MTGIGSDESQLYILGNGYFAPNNAVEVFSWSGTIGDDPYIEDFQGLVDPYDMDVNGGLVWVACDGDDSPVKVYDSSGTLVDFIPGIMVGGEARGVAFESSDIVWISNPETDMIYRIEIGVGLEEEGVQSASALLRADGNPFSASVEILGTGFGTEAVIVVFDTGGRLLESSDFEGRCVLDGSGLPSGAYLVRVSDGVSSASLRLTRL